MVSPMKPAGSNTSHATYSAVPNPNVASPDLNSSSPNPDPYARLSGQTLPEGSYLSPEGVDSPILGRDSMHMPAPSMMSRDSTHSSLLPPGTPNLPGSRSSWGSGTGLAAAAAGISGAEAAGGRRPSVPRGQSNLAHSSVGWNNASQDRLSTSEEDEEQGHIAPAPSGRAGAGGLSEKPAWAASGYAPKKSRKWLWIGLALGTLLLVGLGVGLGLGLTLGKKTTTSGGSSSNDQAGAGASSSHKASGTASATSAASTPTPTTGGQGSLITLEDGSTMTYENSFGGKWVYDPANPFNNEAQAQNYTPPLNQNWTFGVDKIYGVNLGGWLNTEPFIVPGLYETYASGPGGTAVDEYTLSLNMGSKLEEIMTNHYETFITERDFAEIASAGLNWIRLPVAHWAIETWDGEPYLERVSWTYVLKAIGWARKYGIRINFDLHTVPGSQNGWNHSGKLGTINWLNGVMGLANAQRALDYIRTLAQFISQPEYAPVIPMFGFINEPNANGVGKAAVGAFYLEAYKLIREITGVGEGNGPVLTFHDGFLGISQWYDFLPGADRLGMDQHPYMIFGNQQEGALSDIASRPCSYWAAATNLTSNQYGINVAGEWSAAINDCGQWINNVGSGARWDGSYAGYTGPVPGSCSDWNDYTKWSQDTKDNLLEFVSSSMDALQNYFFWTWKIGNSTGAITEVNPFWHYRLGLQHGWIPKDPRSVAGTCAKHGVSGSNFPGTYSSAYMTGGAGANQIPAAQTNSYAWPPASFTNVPAASMDQLPQYVQTGTPITMPAATYTSPGSSQTIDAGNGWYNANAANKAYATVSGCSYPPEYSAATMAIPTNACGAGDLSAPTKRAGVAAPTPAPQR